MEKVLVELFRHNIWANLLLLEACSKLSEDQLDATSVGTYGSVRDTVRHILSAEERNVGRLTGSTPGGPLQGESSLSFDELQSLARSNGEMLQQLAETTDANHELRAPFRDGKEYSIPAWVVLAQAINHSTEHRAQVAAILTQQGVVPPVMDGWTYAYSRGQIKAAL